MDKADIRDLKLCEFHRVRMESNQKFIDSVNEMASVCGPNEIFDQVKAPFEAEIEESRVYLTVHDPDSNCYKEFMKSLVVRPAKKKVAVKKAAAKKKKKVGV